jgi:hypothetical protein
LFLSPADDARGVEVARPAAIASARAGDLARAVGAGDDVERGLERLRPERLGAIPWRTCFFLSSVQQWRGDIVLGRARPEVMADLGHGVMNDAMVGKAAARCLRKV